MSNFVPIPVTPEDLEGATSLTPQRVGLMGQLGAATDRAQGSLYGVAEAAGFHSAAGPRIRNQFEGGAALDQYYAQTGDPRNWDEAQGIGGVAKYARNLGIQSAPYMAASLVGGFAGGVPGAVAVGSVLGTGDVLDNQREQAGETDLLSAVPLGIAYGAADSLLGVGGMAGRAGGALRRKFAGEAAGRIGGTGVSALDDVGMDALNKMTGFTGGLARTGASMAKNAGVEAVTETFQEGMNQLGRMAVDPTESFYNDRSAENFRESAIGGGLLGGIFGGAMGGWRRSASAKPLADPNNSVDVLGTPDPEHVGRSVDGEQYRLSGFDAAPKYNQAAPSLETAQSEIAELLSHRSSILSDPRMQDPEFAGQAAPFLATVDKRVEELQTVGNVHGELAQLMNQKNSILREPRMRFPQFAEQAAPFLATVDKRIAELQKQLPAEPEGQMDLFAQPAWEPQAPQEQLGLQLQNPQVPMQDFINQQLGIGQAPYGGKGYAQQFEAAAVAPTGNRVPDSQGTQIERPETTHEAILREAGLLQQAQQMEAQKLQAQKEAEDTYKRNSATMYGWLHEDEQGPKIPSTLEGSVVKAHRQLLELTDGQEGALGTTLRGSIQALGQPGSDKDVKDAAKAISKAFEAQEKQKAEAQAAAAPAAQGTVNTQAAEPVAPAAGSIAAAVQAPTAPAEPTVTYKRKQLTTGRSQQDAAPVEPAVQAAAPVAPAAPKKPVRTKEDEARFKQLSEDRAVEVKTRVGDNHHATKGTRERLATIANQLEKFSEGAKGATGPFVEKLKKEQTELEQQINQSLPTSAELYEYLKTEMARLKKKNKQGAESVRNIEMLNRFMAVTGMDLDANGELYQARTPKSFGEVAALEGVTKQAVQQSFDRRSISDYALGRVYASLAEKPAAAHGAFEVAAPDMNVEGDTDKQSTAPEAGSADSFESTSDDGLTPNTATEKLTGVNVGSLVQVLSNPGYGAATLRPDVRSEAYERAEKGATKLNQPAQIVVSAQRELETITSAVEQREKSAGIDSGRDRSLDDAAAIHTAEKARDAAVEELSGLLKKVAYNPTQQELVLAAIARKVDKRNLTGAVDSDTEASRDNPAAVLPALKILDTLQKERAAQKLGGQAGVAKLREREAQRKAAKENAEAVSKEAEAKREAEIEARNKARAREGLMRALGEFAQTAAGLNAVSDWNAYRSKDTTLPFDSLPDETKIEWIKTIFNLEEREQNDPNTIGQLQRRFEAANDGVQVLPAGASKQTADVARGQSGDGQGTSSSSRSGDDRARPTVSEPGTTKTTKVENREYASDTETKLDSFPDEVQEGAEAKWSNDYSEGLPWSKLTEAEQVSLAEAYQADQTAEDNYEEANAFQVAAEGVQDARAQAAPKVVAKAKASEVTNYSRSSSNPDQGVNTLPIEAFSGATNARELLNTYLKHATDAALRDLATLFLKIPAIGGVRVTFLKKGDTPGNFITGHFNNGAGALAVTGADGVHLYFRLDDVESFREDTVLHEVLHSLTTAALHRNPELRNELRALAKSISSALGDTAYQSKRGEDANLKNFWSSAVNGSASELLAYGLTSPAFRKLFSQYADDGKPFNDYRPEGGAAVRVNPNRPQSFRLEAPNKPTLFQRVVDFFAKVLGFPQKYKAQFDAATKAYLDKKAANDKAEADYNTMRPLQAKLERALHSLLADTEKRGNALASDTVAEAQMARTPAAPIRGNPAAAALTPGWQGFLDKVKAGGSWALVRGMLTSDLIGAASKVLTSAPKYLDAMNKILVERTKAERDVGVIMTAATKLSNAERGVGAGSVNALLMKSTMSKKWAFVPDWIPKAQGLQADPAMEREFLALSKEAQAVVKQVFKHGYDTTTTLQNEVNKNVASEYDAVIAQLEANGDTEGANREKAKKAKSLQDFQTLLNQRGLWPYAPLRRFGNHVVMAMSKEYLAAKDANDSKLMKELEKDGDHYQVAFAESRSAAVKLRADMEAGNAKFSAANGGYADNFERLSQADSMMGGRDMLSAFRRLRGMVSDSMEGDGAKARAGIDNAMRQLYLQLLAESSARKGEMNRRNVVGADADMIRAFATNGRSTAHFIANLKTGSGVDDALKRMEKEVKVNTPGREARQRYFNEIMKRHTMGLVYDPSPGVDAALAVSSGYMLLSNPSYFIINGTQPWMMSVPLMGGRFGLGKAASAMAKAYGELAMPALKGKLSGTTDLNVQLIIPADAAPAVADLASRGIISIELSHELGGYESVDGGAVKSTFAAGHALIKNVAQGTETFNRLTTAIAAYRLAKGANMSEKAATEYAASVINDTHGDYNGFNYPRFMRTDLGRIATQFRKFQLIQASLFVRLFNDMSRGATADVKKAALWALLYNIGTLVAVGGAVAAPGFVLGATLVGALFGDDDEPNDPRAWLIKAAGKDMGELIYGGVTQFMGVPLGERLGAGQMLSILPYTDLTLTKDGFNGVLRGLSGPLVGGVIGKMWEGMGLGLSGDPYKGFEMALPTGVANLMKAYRFLGEGVTNRNGDVLIAPDDLSGLALLGQAIGMPSSTIKDRMANAASVFESDTFYKNRTSEIKRGYTEAVRAGDTDTTAELREKWSKMQEARARNGYKKQPLSELLKAPQEQLKREARTSGGVQYRDSNQGAVESLTQ